jgi:hypothetical protein
MDLLCFTGCNHGSHKLPKAISRLFPLDGFQTEPFGKQGFEARLQTTQKMGHIPTSDCRYPGLGCLSKYA